ncbi:MAG: galactitol-1-phosphate 5-dehydrogenase [Clostridia bacterium]|nr:galactitol-1-phosphate 5-dehydrogenase [Clostridia bacterium]
MKKTMKALNLHAVGDLRLDELPVAETQDDEVLVRVAYCGICGSDIPRVFDKGTYHFPTVIGHEFSGTVEYDPKGELTGKRVAVFPLLPCFECESCKAENYALCSNYDYYGSRRDGAMAEYISVKRWNILTLPDSVSLAAGAMCEPSAVACHAVKKLGDLTGKSLLISGAGPIGLIAAMWATNKGAEKVYFFDLDERKIKAARELGFYEYEDGIDVDVSIEGTGAGAALARCLKALKPFGQIVLMGNPSRGIELSQQEYWYILRKELRLLGTWNSSFGEIQNDWRDAISAMSERIITPEKLITHRIGINGDYMYAFEMMRDRTDFYQKVMLEVEDK